jgi:hypothetical protein
MEGLRQFHDAARKGLQLTRTRPFPHHRETLVNLPVLPNPLGDQDGVKARLQELVAAPPRPWTRLIQGAPWMAKCRAHGPCNDPLINDFAIQRDCCELAAVCGRSFSIYMRRFILCIAHAMCQRQR